MISRRRFIELSALAAGGNLLASCGGSSTEPSSGGHLTARPGTPTLTPTKGVSALGLSTGRDGVMYVRESYNPATPTALIVALHGAGGSGPVSWTSFYPRAEAHGMILLAPSSRSTTWDLIGQQ